MNSISLKKLSLYSLSLLTLCCMSVASQAQAAETNLEDAGVRSRSSSHERSCNGFRRTEAIVESTNIINTFVLRFSAAVRAPTGSQEQIDLVRLLQQTLTRQFSITFVIGGVALPSATDFNSLLALVQSQSSTSTFDASLNGNLSLESLVCNRRRTLQFQGLQYVVQTPLSGPSILLPALDQWTVVETRCRGFRIKALVATAISTPIPFGTTL
jgi:hypothetical protein